MNSSNMKLKVLVILVLAFYVSKFAFSYNEFLGIASSLSFLSYFGITMTKSSKKPSQL